ncbi:MAG: SPOR domain-containing protein [archaeon]|nr:SPOR domain-containing protein [archaeon]
MQNIDFYSGKTSRDIPPHFSKEDPEYFARLAKVHTREEERSMKKATRMLFLIIALCIVSFTTGLFIGIKFAGESKKDIMDEHTKKTVGNIGKSVANLIKEGTVTDLNAAPVRNNLFSRSQFPYAIKIKKAFSKPKSQEIASFLSSKGQTVILSKNNGNYSIFLGPFRNRQEAKISLKKIRSFSNRKYLTNAVIIKR